jgi:hypothetical protein
MFDIIIISKICFILIFISIFLNIAGDKIADNFIDINDKRLINKQHVLKRTVIMIITNSIIMISYFAIVISLFDAVPLEVNIFLNVAIIVVYWILLTWYNEYLN